MGRRGEHVSVGIMTEVELTLDAPAVIGVCGEID